MLADEIRQFFKGEIITDEEGKRPYSRDASIFEVMPEVVVAPRDVDDIKTLVKFVVAEKKKGRTISITARAAGTDMSGGPLNESIIIDFTKHINRLKEIDATHAVVEPGMFYRDFEKETDKLGVMMPSYPASKSICAIGGIVSNNSGGEKTLAYGKTERYVTRLKIVLEDGEEHTFEPVPMGRMQEKIQQPGLEGEVYAKLFELVQKNDALLKTAKPRVSKNSAGYYLWNVWDGQTFDITKLLVGSQGTLGLVTEVTFALVPKKSHSRLAVVFLKDLAPLADIVGEVLKFNPESFESYDDATLKLAMRFLPDLLHQMSPWNAIKLGLQFIPDFWMVLRSGFPKLVLLAELTGDDEKEISGRLKELKASLARFHVPIRLTKREEEAEKYWTVRRESFNLLRHKVKDKQTVPFIDDVIVRPEHLPEFLPKLNAILEKYRQQMIYTIAGHAGDGNFHIIPLMNLSDPVSLAMIPRAADEVYALVLSFKGSITAEHNDGLIRTPYLEQMYGKEITALFEETKHIFDPLGIFNPHKKVGGNWAYALQHIKAK